MTLFLTNLKFLLSKLCKSFFLVLFRRFIDIPHFNRIGTTFDDTFWSYCPKESITFDRNNFCITYICNGTFSLSRSAQRDQQVSVQNNILQSVAFDAAATGLEVVGVCLEFFLMPLLM
jgi:hypothetical protein